MLIFSINAPVHDTNGIADAAVRIAADGKVLGVEYPLKTLPGGYPWPRRIAAAEISAADWRQWRNPSFASGEIERYRSVMPTAKAVVYFEDMQVGQRFTSGATRSTQRRS